MKHRGEVKELSHHVCHYRDLGCFWRGNSGIPDGARAPQGAHATCRTYHYRRGCNRHAANMSKAADEESAYLSVLRVFIFSFLKGSAPIMAVEVARRAIPGHVRPSFQEIEKACRGGGEPATNAAAASA